MREMDDDGRYPLDGLAVAEFLNAVRDDSRITPCHMSLFLAIVSYRGKGRIGEKIYAFSYELMPLAKISSAATYHKCIKDLHDFGYIDYESSFNRIVGSRIVVVKKKNNEKQ
jgi:hypothetical protein